MEDHPDTAWLRLRLLQFVRITNPFASNKKLIRKAKELERYMFNVKDADIVSLKAVKEKDI